MKAKEIISLRSALGVTHTEFAGALGTSLSTVYRWEQDGTEGANPVFTAILNALRKRVLNADEYGRARLRSVFLQGIGEVFFRGLSAP